MMKGGQFPSAKGGQFESALTGHLKSAGGGQFHRRVHHKSRKSGFYED
jgi:hypothetical protein